MPQRVRAHEMKCSQEGVSLERMHFVCALVETRQTMSDPAYG